MTKYFARIDHQNKGPFSLLQLIDAGIRPSTYIWTKGMDDWQQAADVADVCRAMRLRLAGLPVPGEESPAAPSGKQPGNSALSDINGMPVRGIYGFPEPESNTDFNIKPQGISVVMAVIVTLLCFPITGIMAIWFACRFNSEWTKSEQDGISGDERRKLRVMAYEKARMYRMMIGLSFSLGIIMYGMMLTARL